MRRISLIIIALSFGIVFLAGCSGGDSGPDAATKVPQAKGASGIAGEKAAEPAK